MRVHSEHLGSTIDGAIHEIFNIDDHAERITKYRIAIYCMPEVYENRADLLQLTPNEKKIAKIKQISYALNDQPDLETVATFFTDNVEFKIWSWNDQKYFSFTKQDFATRYRELEDNMEIRHVILAEIVVNSDRAIGVYAYDLRDKDLQEKKITVWVNKWVFTFDEDLRITKLYQMGDVFPDIAVNHVLKTREEMTKRVRQFFDNHKCSLDRLYSGDFDLECVHYRFSSTSLPKAEVVKVRSMTETMMKMKEKFGFEWIWLVDVYCGQQDDAYEVSNAVTSCQFTVNQPGHIFRGCIINVYNVIKFLSDDNKVMRITHFMSDISEPIDSPFDDVSFNCSNIKKID